LALATPAFAATYDPLNVIPYDTWRASSSMTASDIQTFLEAVPGPLKTLDEAKDHNGVRKPASKIIWEAAQAWNLNPKVILATLQKEQSLLTYYVGMPYKGHFLTQTEMSAIYKKAMGYYVYDIDGDGEIENGAPGLGLQIWGGAKALSTYETRFNWFPGKTKVVTAYKTVDATKSVDGEIVHYDKRVSYKRTIVPENASTFALYTYTPYYPQKLVWDIYVRYFGDPAAAARLRPVYRFRNNSTHAYYYTIMEGTRYKMITKSSGTWTYGGVAFTIDTSSSINTEPLYRLRSRSTGHYIYTVYAATRDHYLKVHHWVLSGTVGRVAKRQSATSDSGDPVYRLVSKSNGSVLLTRNLSTKTSLSGGRHPSYSYTGIAFYLGHSVPTTTPVGP
jgi:hypothetical protein